MKHTSTVLCVLALAGCGDDEPAPRSPRPTTPQEKAVPTPQTSASPDGGTAVDDGFLDALTATNGFTLGLPTSPRPTPDGKAVVFLRSGPRDRVNALFTFAVETGRTNTLLEPSRVLGGASETLTPEEAARRERLRLQTSGFVDFEILPDGTQLLTSLAGKLYLVSLADGAMHPLETGGAVDSPKVSPDGKAVAYVRGGDLYVLPLEGGPERRLTTDASAEITNGLAEFVAQEEMDRPEGLWWSPDSTQIAFERADATGVERRTVLDETDPFRPATSVPYPRAGKANVAVKVGIVPAQGGAPRWVEWDHDRHTYLARVAWQKDSPLTLQVQTRDQKEVVVLVVDPRTGATTPVHTERDEAWVALHDGLRWIGHGASFLWITERNGAPELELRSAAGSLVRTLAGAQQGFRSLLDVDEEAGSVAFEGGANPARTSIFRMPIAGGEALELTREPGIHNATFGTGHAIFVDEHRSLEAMPVLRVRGADGTSKGMLPSVAEVPPIEVRVQIERLGDGEGWMTAVLSPASAVAGQRYPLLARVYGGPGAQTVVEDRALFVLWQWVANQGFVVAFADNRGTPGRGRTFERAIRDRLADVPLSDQVAAMREVAKRPDVDGERVGIIGWSFGGFLAALGVLRQPDFFKAAVAIAPVTDWADYDTHYTERYLGLPSEDPARYPQSSVLRDAAQLRRPLLLMHGSADDNVVVGHSLKLARELLAAGRDFEILLFPGQTHMIADPVMREQVWSRAVAFLRRALGPG
jgi:dipeptidyl-peptidase-4